jgi:hypothetical protein
MAANFPFKSTGKDIQNGAESKAGCLRTFFYGNALDFFYNQCAL